MNVREILMNAFATEHLHVTAFLNTNLPNMFTGDIPDYNTLLSLYDLTTLLNSSDNFNNYH